MDFLFWLIDISRHSTRLLLLRLKSLEMEGFLLCLAFFTPVQHTNGARWNDAATVLK